VTVYRRKTPVVQAYRWWKNGDHRADHVGDMVPDPTTGELYERVEGAVVRFFSHPEIPADRECTHCGQPMRVHGWVDQTAHPLTVCPGDWVVGNHHGHYTVSRDPVFKELYEVYHPADIPSEQGRWSAIE